ncbi:MAG: helix-turn-helix domain-containing protein [Acidipropionibacterium sp.]|jgi:transcriptional regulator with XRE-family HTH domain|nr:helix-turn-helix domain-containing protein [Acidipropionibacterium sp.]
MTTRPFIDTVERLAEVISTARTEHGWSQAELAERAGVSQFLVAELEAGHPRAEVPGTLDVLDMLGLDPRAIPIAPSWAFDATGAYAPELRRSS